ncbi:MAG: hypothetical protein AAF492_29540, partial [Verrucomicrobiota bacterium]
EQAIDLDANNLQAYYYLGLVRTITRQHLKAVDAYKEGLACEPDHVLILNNLGWMHATSNDTLLKDPKRAIDYAEKAVALTRRERPSFLDTLAVAYAANQQFDRAIDTGDEALANAQALGKEMMVKMLANRLANFERNQHLRRLRSRSGNE